MKIVVVECREAVEGRFDSDLAHVASSREKAMAWIKENPDWCIRPLWWWVVCEREVDGEMIGVPRFYARDGMELHQQPAPVPIDS